MPKPVPVPDELTKPFWDACNERRLVIQNCTDCNKMQHPPEKTCTRCGSDSSLTWREVSGRGTVLGGCTVYDTRIRSLQAHLPFNIAVIALEDDPDIMLFSHLEGTPVDEIPAGAKAQVEFEDVSPDQLIFEWRVVS